MVIRNKLVKQTKFSLFQIIASISLFILASTNYSIAQKTLVIGEVSGVWKVSGNPYYVTGDIWINQGKTLIIEPGVDIQFAATYAFWVNGLLKANGTANNRIVFRGNGSAGSWKTIYFSETASPGCILNYCVIKDGGYEKEANLYVINNNTNVTISCCNIYNSSVHGICIVSSITVQGYYRQFNNITKLCKPNIIKNSINNNAGIGIYICSFYENNGYRSDNNTCISSPLICNNCIYNNLSNGILCYTYANGGWSNEYLYADKYANFKTNPIIQQNTIYGNYKNGIQCDLIIQEYFWDIIIIETNPLITTNIIAGNNKYGINANTQTSQ